MKGAALLLVGFGLVAGCGDRDAGSVTLANHGRTEHRIVIPVEANPTDRFAAEELKTFLGESTGADFPIVTESGSPSAAKRTIEIGTAWARAQVARVHPAALEDEESVYVVRGGCVAIAGGGRTGNAYGVYSFLERELGCRWFSITGDNLVPRHPQLTVCEKTVAEKPVLAYRCILEVGGAMDRESGDHLFLFRNRINQVARNYENVLATNLVGALVPRIRDNPRGCHTLYEYIPPRGQEAYFKTHPEFFTLDESGKRVERHLCFSCPGLRKEMTKNFLAHVARSGGKGFFDLSQNDAGGRFCCCPGCRKLEEKYGAPCGPLLDYLIELSPVLKARHPDAIVHTFAYHKDSTQKPPKGIDRLPDNVAIVFPPVDDDFSKDLAHPNNVETLNDLRHWCRLGKVWLWGYPVPYAMPTPVCGTLGRTAADVRLCAEAGLTGTYIQHDVGTKFGCGFADAQMWMLMQAYRDPTRDWRTLRDEFCRFYYDAAAEDVIAYDEFLERGRESLKSFVTSFGCLDGFLTPEQVVDWQERFSRMEEKVGSRPDVVQRLRELRLPLDVLTLSRWEVLRQKGLSVAGGADGVHARARAALDRGVARRITLDGPRGDALRRRYRDCRFSKILDIKHFLASVTVKPLPEEFKGIPEDRIVQVFVDESPYQSVKRVAMPDAATGFALVETDVPEDKQLVPFPVGVYDKTGERYVLKSPIPADRIVPGEFRLYKLGRGTISSPHSFIWVGHSWKMGLSCQDCYHEGMEEAWDIYVSLKFEGPAYDPSSQLKKSAVYLDRAVFLRPQAQ